MMVDEGWKDIFFHMFWINYPTDLIGLFLIGKQETWKKDVRGRERGTWQRWAGYDQNTLYIIVPGLFPQFHPHECTCVKLRS